MKKVLMVMLSMVSLVVMTGCYRPSWYRANTTYAQLKSDSEWCKSQVNIGSTREETIIQYERCMKDKGHELKDKSAPTSDEPIRVERHTGPIEIDKNTKVYIAIYGGTISSGGGGIPTYKYFHKKDCRQLSNLSIKEITAGEAIANGKTMCPDCFRD